MLRADQKRGGLGLRRVPVMLPYPFPGPFDYSVPDGIDPHSGDVVMVPLNGREQIGVVWDSGPDPAVSDSKLKPLVGIVDTPPMSESVRRFVDWIAAYTLSPPGEVMAMGLRVARQPTGPASGWRRAAVPPDDIRMTEARRRVLSALERAEPRTTTELAHAADVSTAVIRGMADAGLIVADAMPADLPFIPPDPNHPGPMLSPEQEQAADTLRHAVAEKTFEVRFWTASPGPARPRYTLKRWRNACARAAKR